MDKELHLTKKDFRIEWFSGKGAGGQYRNKHQNCCRIIHIASGLMATGQSNRDRPSNQREAFKKLAGMLLADLEIQAERRSTCSVVREYHFERNRVIDYGSGETAPTAQILDGDLDNFILNRGKCDLPKTGRSS